MLYRSAAVIYHLHCDWWDLCLFSHFHNMFQFKLKFNSMFLHIICCLQEHLFDLNTFLGRKHLSAGSGHVGLTLNYLVDANKHDLYCAAIPLNTPAEDLSVYTELKPSLICCSIFYSSRPCDLHFITVRVFCSITDSLLTDSPGSCQTLYLQTGLIPL